MVAAIDLIGLVVIAGICGWYGWSSLTAVSLVILAVGGGVAIIPAVPLIAGATPATGSSWPHARYDSRTPAIIREDEATLRALLPTFFPAAAVLMLAGAAGLIVTRLI